jgi:CxxC motif-containing protein (DUF1111 family)
MRAIVSAAVVFLAALSSAPGILSQGGPVEAPAGFTVASNGFAEEFCANQAALANSPNSPRIDADECNFAAAAEEFTGPESLADGLGPVFNAAGCGECHLVPILGGGSQITEKRAGLFRNGVFTEHPGGSLIHDRATDPRIQEIAFSANTNVVALRASVSVLGDGFVEALANSTLQQLASRQPAAQRGQLINVPVFEAPRQSRIGRFGWKNQQASLVSFSADAYVNEMGITSPLQPTEPTSNGASVANYDHAPEGRPNDPDDEGVDVELFALFMRSTLAPPVDAARASTTDARAGSTLFNQVGCGVCHTRTLVTAAPGTLINGGVLKVARAVGNKIIHPFSDFLLHDVGTGDGIVQNGGPTTRNKIRTAPLWGLRARGRFMHDALSLSVVDAINRHRNQGQASRSAFNALSTTNRNRLLAFLMSL